MVRLVRLGFEQEQLGHVVVRKLHQLDTPVQYRWYNTVESGGRVGHSIVHLGQLMHDFRLLALCSMCLDVEVSCP